MKQKKVRKGSVKDAAKAVSAAAGAVTLGIARPCDRARCRKSYVPRRAAMRFCSANCRKRDHFERQYGELPKAAFKAGDVVCDLNGRVRTVAEVVYSVAYFLDGGEDELYQPDEIMPLHAKEK